MKLKDFTKFLCNEELIYVGLENVKGPIYAGIVDNIPDDVLNMEVLEQKDSIHIEEMDWIKDEGLGHKMTLVVTVK